MRRNDDLVQTAAFVANVNLVWFPLGPLPFLSSLLSTVLSSLSDSDAAAAVFTSAALLGAAACSSSLLFFLSAADASQLGIETRWTQTRKQLNARVCFLLL